MFKKLVLIFILILPVSAQAVNVTPEAKVFDLTGKLKTSFSFFDSSYRGSADLALGDINGDGIAEILICPGIGSQAIVKIYNAYGVEKDALPAYSSSFKGGCYVATGDTNNNKQAEIITGAGFGGGPQIRIFEIGKEIKNFFAFAKTARQGVRVLANDLGSDGTAELITYSNLNTPAEYDIFGNDGHLIATYKLKDLNNNGLSLASGDFNGDGIKEIAVAGGFGNKSNIKINSTDGKLIKEIIYSQDYLGGLNLSAGDVNGDGKDEIIVSESFEGQGNIYFYNFDGNQIKTVIAYEGNYRNGVKTAMADVDGDGKLEIVAIPERAGDDLSKPDYKYISVDLSKQTLYRYQNGSLLDKFLISSGKASTPTPVGEYQVYKKRPSVRMSWYFGPNNPQNYDLPNVPWVASFFGPYTIHGTYWHSNFGHPMSHGCINMYTPDSKTVYDWSEIGTPVVIEASMTKDLVTKK